MKYLLTLYFLLMVKLISAQQLESCKIYQIEGNDSANVKQVGMRVCNSMGKISAEYLNHYKENFRDTGNSFADFYTYRDTLLIQKVRAEENGDSLKWMYFYNVGRFKIRESRYKFTHQQKENTPLEHKLIDHPESFEKERTWWIVEDLNYKVDVSGKVLERTSQLYEKPDVEKSIYEYDAANRLSKIINYHSGQLQSSSNYQYQNNSYSIIVQEFNHDQKNKIDTTEFILTSQLDVFGRCISTTKVLKDPAKSEFIQRFKYSVNRIIREENIFQFNRDGSPVSEKLTHLFIYEY